MQRVIGAHPSYLPAAPTLPRLRPGAALALRLAGQVLVIGIAAVLYFLVRGLVDGREAQAFQHAASLIDLERDLGIFWEPRLQGWALDIGAIGTVANWIYIWGHWPVIAVTLSWLVIAHREQYGLYRTALLLSGAVGLVVFTLYPMAPPRFMDAYGFVDTITLHSN